MNNKDIYHQHGYTKHYYVEADRIASKIGGGMSHSGNDFGEHIYEFDISTQNDYGRKSEENAKTMYNHLDSAQSNLGKQFEVLVDVDYRIIRKFTETDEEERHIFFFHKDHLGSSTQISDRDQRVIHHIEYMPTGELFAEQRDYWHTPYRFNGKELDEETGLYYYGARYYTPELGIWLSVDPLSDKYPSMSAFMYCAGNPVVLVDPDGRDCVVSIEGNTMTVRADIYMKKYDDKTMSKIVAGANMWNNTTGYKYEKDGNSYDVKFEINLITSDADGNDFTDAFDASNAHYEGSSDLSNTLQVGITNTKDKGVRAKGEATYGKYITLDSETFDSRTAAHEMGHILGLGEWTGGLMESGGSSTNITKGMIEGIMYNSGMMQNPGNQSSDHQLPKVGNTFDPGKINLKGINNNLKNGVVK